jgi:8-oxo-dGTP pyrophosphatase MutT (NUDIX family)
VFCFVLFCCSHIVGTGTFTCPYCQFYNLTEDELWRHTPAYHINSLGKNHTKCPICRDHVSRKPLQVHIHDDHGPVSRARNGGQIEEQASIRCYSFSLVVCRHPLSGHFLLCQEFSGQGFWLPGGAVDAGESYATAAHRETIEEAGVAVELKGILRIEHSPSKTGPQGGFYVRQRVIYYAEPKDNLNCVPKSIPDFESAGNITCNACTYHYIHAMISQTHLPVDVGC